MRFHLPALPGPLDDSCCAYTQKVVKFKAMMEPRGHEVFIYEAPGEALEFVPELWAEANADQAARINENAQEGDYLGIIAGLCQQSLADAVPLMAVEYGIGYGGTFAPYRVFESYAWMHTVYGHQQGTHSADGHFYDAVIPNYFDPADFPFSEDKGDYLLYLGRMIERKGVQVAAETAERAGVPLIYAGAGEDVPDYGEHIGPVGPKERGELLAGAKALIAPTLYVEPFGGCVAEAMLCGTPVITTDWGAFTETVAPGVTGYRCRPLAEFVAAVEKVDDLDNGLIRDYALSRFSLDAVAPQYETYFSRLNSLRGDGWYSESELQGA